MIIVYIDLVVDGINHTRLLVIKGSVCYVMILRMNITLFVFVNYINN